MLSKRDLWELRRIERRLLARARRRRLLAALGVRHAEPALVRARVRRP